MSGFKISNNPYPGILRRGVRTRGFRGLGDFLSGLALVPMHGRHAKGLGDLSTLADDWAAGDFAAVISDLLPVAAVGVIGIFLFNRIGSDERNRKARSAALKRLDLQYQLQKQEIDKKYPVKKKTKKKSGASLAE